MNPGVDPVKVNWPGLLNSVMAFFFKYIIHFHSLAQDAYPDGDRHLIKDSDLFQVCVYDNVCILRVIRNSWLTYSPW